MADEITLALIRRLYAEGLGENKNTTVRHGSGQDTGSLPPRDIPDGTSYAYDFSQCGFPERQSRRRVERTGSTRSKSEPTPRLGYSTETPRRYGPPRVRSRSRTDVLDQPDIVQRVDEKSPFNVYSQPSHIQDFDSDTYGTPTKRRQRSYSTGRLSIILEKNSTHCTCDGDCQGPTCVRPSKSPKIPKLKKAQDFLYKMLREFDIDVKRGKQESATAIKPKKHQPRTNDRGPLRSETIASAANLATRTSKPRMRPFPDISQVLRSPTRQHSNIPRRKNEAEPLSIQRSSSVQRNAMPISSPKPNYTNVESAIPQTTVQYDELPRAQPLSRNPSHDKPLPQRPLVDFPPRSCYRRKELVRPNDQPTSIGRTYVEGGEQEQRHNASSISLSPITESAYAPTDMISELGRNRNNIDKPAMLETIDRLDDKASETSLCTVIDLKSRSGAQQPRLRLTEQHIQDLENSHQQSSPSEHAKPAFVPRNRFSTASFFAVGDSATPATANETSNVRNTDESPNLMPSPPDPVSHRRTKEFADTDAVLADLENCLTRIELGMTSGPSLAAEDRIAMLEKRIKLLELVTGTPL